MKIRFSYNENTPSYESYQELLTKMEDMSKEFKALDILFLKDYDYKLIKEYENKKVLFIREMFNIILSYFPYLKEIPCAIYLNGSYARRNITAGSDMDLTFYFNKKDVAKYQPTIYMIRYAISKMFDVNVVHVHSFTKNFPTEYRKKNNLVVTDPKLETIITWQDTNKTYTINYPYNEMIPEREICEISSIKNIDDLRNLFMNQINKHHPKEWIYTQECIHITDNKFKIENVINELDNKYGKKEIIDSLDNIKKELFDLLFEIKNYFNQLEDNNDIDLARFNMIGKRKVTMVVHAFATYLRWYYINKRYDNVPITLNLNDVFNYEENSIVDSINKDYCYFRYLISRVEIWAKKYNHYYGHRSREVVNKDVFNNEYNSIWNNNYPPIKEQVKIVYKILDNIEKFVK